MGRETRSNHPGGGWLWYLLWLLLLLPLLAAQGPGRSPTAATPTSALVCGKPKVMSKIYGGQDVVAGQWPWQASLLYRNLHICGAVLIDARWLVTTAHCFVNKSHAPEDYLVTLGSTQLYQHTQHTRKMYVSRIITHPSFEKFHAFGNDIAMLQLHLPVNFTSYISPACLPTAGMQLPIHRSCWITGWGMLSED
ncbi:putative serine protease 47, partial [Pteropus vampyrus]|uniref:Serine protease 47 n=1 Tax=Pteropus vampyrus TaxID=132908 RepID=A0A6P6C6F7_PTEVA